MEGNITKGDREGVEYEGRKKEMKGEKEERRGWRGKGHGRRYGEGGEGEGTERKRRE